MLERITPKWMVNVSWKPGMLQMLVLGGDMFRRSPSPSRVSAWSLGAPKGPDVGHPTQVEPTPATAFGLATATRHTVNVVGEMSSSIVFTTRHGSYVDRAGLIADGQRDHVFIASKAGTAAPGWSTPSSACRSAPNPPPQARERNPWISCSKDGHIGIPLHGVTIFPSATEQECWSYLLRAQDRAVQWALANDGYVMEPTA